MKFGKILILTIAFSLFAVGAFAEDDSSTDNTDTTVNQRVHGPGFVDLDGDGYNDNAPDADGDGIPNGQDPDWEKGAGNGQGYHNGRGRGAGFRGNGRMKGTGRGHGAGRFVDENGDGFNDNAPDADGDGIPNGRDSDFVRGAGQGRFAGQGPYFVDADGDGICDRLQQQKKKAKKAKSDK